MNITAMKKITVIGQGLLNAGMYNTECLFSKTRHITLNELKTVSLPKFYHSISKFLTKRSHETHVSYLAHQIHTDCVSHTDMKIHSKNSAVIKLHSRCSGVSVLSDQRHIPSFCHNRSFSRRENFHLPHFPGTLHSLHYVTNGIKTAHQYLSKRSLTSTTKSNECRDKAQNHTTDTPKMQFVEVAHQGRRCNIAYIDAGPHNGQIALAVHGLPGSFSDFDNLVDPFVKAGIRFIAFDYPGPGPNSTVEDLKSFDFSTDSRADMTLSFMEALNIEKIDFLIGHSGGGGVVLHLCALTDHFTSCVLLHSVCHSPHRTLRPPWLIRLLRTAARNRLVEPIFSSTLPLLFRIAGFKLQGKHDKVKLRSSLLSVAAYDFQKHIEYAKLISEKQLHTLFVCSKTDSIIDWPIPAEMIKLLNIDVTNQLKYSADGDQYPSKSGIHDVTHGRFARALVFDRGGHFTYRKYPGIFIKHFLLLSERIKNV